MKKNNPLKKLRLLKKTIAHLDNEQMSAAHGGNTFTQKFCGETESESSDIVTLDCTLIETCA